MQEVVNSLCSYWWLVFLFLLVFGGGFFAGAKSLIRQWRQSSIQARRREQENDLKRDMVARGFSPAEIVQVIQARPGTTMPSTAGNDLRQANLVATLAEHGMEAEGIEGIVKALGESADDELPGKIAAVQLLAEQGMDAEGIERVIRALPPAAPRGTDATAFKA